MKYYSRVVFSFWATVCKTVRPMLSYRRPVCPVLSVLSVTLMYSGQMVGRIKMKLGMQVGLGPGHIVLDGDPALPPSKGGGAPNFRPISVVAKLLDGSRCHLVWRKDSAQATLCQMGPSSSPQKRPISIVAKWLDASRCHSIWLYASAQASLF